jgi:hypothetical protein
MGTGMGTGRDAKPVHLTGLHTPHKDGVAPPPPLFLKKIIFYFFILIIVLFVYNFKYKII